MQVPASVAARLRVGEFEVDLHSGELRRNGDRIKLQEQPFQILAELLARPGEVVTREEIQQRLWPTDTFVDFEHGINTAVKKLRAALGDDADNPRFIETLPRYGYRLVAPVEVLGVNVAGPESGIRLVPPPRESANESAPQEAPQDPTLPKTTRGLLYYGLAMLGAVVVTVAALVLWKTVFSSQRAPKVISFTKLTNDGQAKFGPIVTDGSRIYFNEGMLDAPLLIHQVSVKGGEVTTLSVPLKAPEVLDISRDGTELLVANAGGAGKGDSFWVQPGAGGAPRQVGTVIGWGAAFGADGASVIYGAGTKDRGIYSASLGGSSTRKLLATEGIPFGFRFSPDTRRLRFTLLDRQEATTTLMEAAPDGTGLHQMFAGGAWGQWTPDGRFFIFQKSLDGRSDIWALPEERSFLLGKVEDRPTRLTAGPLDFQHPLPGKDGRQIFAIGTARRCEVVRYDAHTGEFVAYLPGISADGLAFSPDGQWVTYNSYPEGTLWRSKVDGSERLQLTFPPMQAFLPRWSPDAKQIVFSARLPDSTWNLYLISSEGGTPQRILPSEKLQSDPNWSPDGNSLVFSSGGLFTIDLRSRRVSMLPGSTELHSPHWSPNGRYIGALTTGAWALMIFDFTTQEWTEAFPSMGASATWSRDGKYIYFLNNPAPDFRYRVLRFRMSDRKIEEVTDLKNAGPLAGTVGEWLGLAPDDSPLVTRDISTQEIYALEMDWP